VFTQCGRNKASSRAISPHPNSLQWADSLELSTVRIQNALPTTFLVCTTSPPSFPKLDPVVPLSFNYHKDHVFSQD
jgi:hypothetical protein